MLSKKIKSRLGSWKKILGPGFITGASDDDPSGIATYAQTGAQFGYTQLWASVWTLPFMITVQEMCGRIGMVTGKSLVAVLKEHFDTRIVAVVVFGLLIANTINVGANLGAMASSIQLVFGMPFYFWLILLAGLSVILQIRVPYPAYARFLKYLAMTLCAYIVAAFIVIQPWGEIGIHALIPQIRFDSDYLINIVAILGTTISPYLFFWQTDQEAEEDIEQHRIDRRGKVRVGLNDIGTMRLDTVVGMLFSNVVMFFIIVTSATTLGAYGIADINTADQAAVALRPLAGDFAYLLFALGIVGTGMLAVPVLAGSAAHGLSVLMGKRAGLHYSWSQARYFYTMIGCIVLTGVLINVLPVPPFKLLYITAVINGIVAPPILVLIVLIASSKAIMGKYASGAISKALGWIITVCMSIAAIFLITSMVL